MAIPSREGSKDELDCNPLSRQFWPDPGSWSLETGDLDPGSWIQAGREGAKTRPRSERGWPSPAQKAARMPKSAREGLDLSARPSSSLAGSGKV